MTAAKIAIIGSGPSGCYTAQFLNKALPEAEICVMDRLPVPFGLVRYGVAPDHVGTKNVTKQFERLFAQDNVHFIGHVDVGVDISLAQLQAMFDVVVFASGLSQDRALNIEGESLQGVIGSGVLTRWSNDHPDTPEFIDIGERVLIIGNGNVAMDVARLLSKNAADFEGSEMRPETVAHIQKAAVKHIDIVGRSEMDAAKYDAVMVKELLKTEGVRLVLGHNAQGEHEKSMLLTQLAEQSHDQQGTDIVFHYGLTPQYLQGDAHLQAAVFTNAQGEEIVFSADTLISAIGFEASCKHPLQLRDLHTDDTDLNCGFLQHNVYCVGWARRGPVGTIPENRKDAKLVADVIVAALQTQDIGNKGGLKDLLSNLHQPHTDFDDWLRLNQFEISQAVTGRHRLKIKSTEQVLQWLNIAKQSV
ncbi:NAD(P)-binding adrenodoxin reductase family protein [Vitreoscilla sp. C1]|uniref:FAD-dependent oxidoreductase n=1 Tax=Vitreoscilla sp. (strain C1) TaxID=96942 RepID=UPI00148E910D|nr:FAD-dependent oxidoreductase [Vitreoscilla sp. C1]AUZ05664.2 NAD(P)-binding adrenodoxin reductase family protein [Vitreoscilla sp. C1]